MATAEALMTAEEFGQRPDPGYPEELVQGRIYSVDQEPEVLGPDDELTVPELLEKFRVAVHRFFD